MSAEFDTIDHVVLINTLRTDIGIAGTSLECFVPTYLTVINMSRLVIHYHVKDAFHMEYPKAPCLTLNLSYYTTSPSGR